MFIVVYGEPIGGFFFIGPFDTRDEASEEACNAQGWVAELEKPGVYVNGVWVSDRQ